MFHVFSVLHKLCISTIPYFCDTFLFISYQETGVLPRRTEVGHLVLWDSVGGCLHLTDPSC